MVEFKINYVVDADALEKKLAERDYVPQVARCLLAAERRLGERPQPVICLLNYGGAVHLEEDRWQSELCARTGAWQELREPAL